MRGVWRVTVAQLVDNDWNAGGGAEAAARVVCWGECVVLPWSFSPLRKREAEGRGEERAHPLGTSAPDFCPLFYCIFIH